MDEAQRMAYQNAQTTAAMIEAMGMQAENQKRTSNGEALAYNDLCFFGLIDKYGLGCNTVQTFIQGF